MRVFLLDGDPLFRQALVEAAAGLCADLHVVCFDTVEALRAGLHHAGDVALVLLDLQGGGMGALLALKHDGADVPVALVSAREDRDAMRVARAHGAAGFIVKTGELWPALRALLAGERWFPGAARPLIASGLSATQMRIVEGVQRGLLNKQIAWELGLSEHTIKYHLSGIFRKTGCHRRSQLLTITGAS